VRIGILADGLAEHTRRWATFFAGKGHEVHLITWNERILPDYGPVVVHQLRKRITGPTLLRTPRNFLAIKAAVREILARHRVEVLHAHSAGSYAWIARAARFRPYIVTPWGTDILVDAKKHWFVRMLTKWALRGAEGIVSDAVHMSRELAGLGVDESKIELVMFGVNLERFQPAREGVSDLRNRFNLGSHPVVISTRTLNPIHDVETFVRAIPLIAKAMPDARFVVASDGKDRMALEHLVDQLKVRDIVRFPGYLKEDEMATWLAVASVYVSTSLADAGLAGSTAEAMATELPVVVTSNADNESWVGSGEGGFLVPERNPDAVARATIELLRDANARRRFGIRNRRVIAERNNYHTEMTKMEAIYRKAILDHEPRAPA
jgi:L-malate glycosyltransferase